MMQHTARDMSVTTPAGEWARTKTLRRTRAVLQNTLLFPGLSSFCRLTVRNREAFGMLQGGAVFVANHCSALDGAVMVEALPPRYRNRSVVVAAADSIFKRKWEAALAEEENQRVHARSTYSCDLRGEFGHAGDAQSP